MSQMSQMPDANPRKGFLKRLSYYLIGTAIGLMLLGFFQQSRTRALQQRVAQQNQAVAQPARTPAEDAPSEPDPGEPTLGEPAADAP